MVTVEDALGNAILSAVEAGAGQKGLEELRVYGECTVEVLHCARNVQANSGQATVVVGLKEM